MADHRITDFVDQSAIDRLQELNNEMIKVKDTYEEVAKKLIKGLDTKVNNLEDLERLVSSYNELEKVSVETTERHNRVITERNRIAANTTNTISRQLMEQEKLNEKNRDAYTRQKDVKEILTQAVSSYSDMTKRLAEIAISQDKLNEQKRKEKKLYEEGKITQEQYASSLQNIIKQQQALAAEKSQLEAYTKSEAKENANASSSYNAMSQELLRLKKAYRELDEEGRNTEMGKNMLSEIKELGAHLKDMDASMGDFQRNVGDYAIACSNGTVVTEDLNRVLGLQAGTIAGCIEQNKELEKAKQNLDIRDSEYASTLEKINAKIAENKSRIADVDAILHKEATTVAEAEAQNKQLAEALKLIDIRSDGARKRIDEINNKIAENKRVIEENTSALQDSSKASEGVANQFLTLIGINGQFGSSLKSLAEKSSEGGNFLEGLTVKSKAFYKTILGLVSNPWMLALLGITGVVAGVKWWYDYNKGLIEATRLTKDFTGKEGDDLKNFRSEVQGVADTFGKDFKDVLNATDKMASQLGITFEEALDTIKDGFIANADAQGNFLSNIDKFTPALRDAGLSAKEMVAIISQTRSGVFSEDGLKAIQVASDRIKRMPKSTKEALQAIGMSGDEIKKSLEDGSKSMMDIIQEVSGKLKEFPQNSEAYGDAIFNVFGRKAAAGGALLIESLADINTNLDEEKKKMGELGEIQEKQMQSQIELDKTLAAVFDATGGSFESMTATAKTFINNGIVKIIHGCVDIINWFIKLYNQSLVVRAGFNYIVFAFKNIWEVCKTVVNQVIIAFKALGEVVEGVLTLNVDKIAEGYKNGLNALKANVTTMVKNIANNTADAFQDTLNDRMKEINIDLKADASVTPVNSDEKRNGKAQATDASKAAADKAAKAAAKESEKLAKEEIKRLNELEESKLKIMEEGHEKELAQIRFNYNKKIREITGNSEKEKDARITLIEAMKKDLAECERKYQEQLASINLANRIAAAKKGSKEELNLKLQQLDEAKKKEIEEAKKTGADLSLIESKFAKQRLDILEDYAEQAVRKTQDKYAAQAAIANISYVHELNLLRETYARELLEAKGNYVRIEKIKEDYERKVAELTEKYSEQSANTQIEMFEEILKTEDISAEEREKMEQELAKAKMDLETAVADHTLAENQRILDAEEKAKNKRIDNAKQVLQAVSDGLNAANDLASAIYDAKVQRIEEEQEASEQASEKEKERITELVTKKVITEEEGEARSRAAEAKSARQSEDLEKKKQQIKYKQAVWEKTNSIAQAGISIAMSILESSKMGFPAAIPFIALASALGALQLATIIATPIPKYAEGTDNHPGGPAIVGDGMRPEVVVVGGRAFITPDKPTVIDLPRGAQVLPDVQMLALPQRVSEFESTSSSMPVVNVNNDFRKLERLMDEANKLIGRFMKQEHRRDYILNYENYKRTRL